MISVKYFSHSRTTIFPFCLMKESSSRGGGNVGISVPDDKRISLDTVFPRPNQPLKVGVWGMASDLKLVATKDNG